MKATIKQIINHFNLRREYDSPAEAAKLFLGIVNAPLPSLGDPVARGQSVEKRMLELNTLVGTHGVEAIQGKRPKDARRDWFFTDTIALFLNAGDTYNATLVYNAVTGRFSLTTLGDFVEKNQRRYRLV